MIDALKKNLGTIRERVEQAVCKSGRSIDDVTLIGVTKYVDTETTRALVDSGCRHLGESRPQLMWEKADALSGLDVTWHMIGHLQRNKVKRTVECASLIHSVDSQRLLKAIDDAGQLHNKRVDVLLEVNVSGESAKHGFVGEDLGAALAYAGSLSNVVVKGLMCMAGLVGDLSDARREFASLRELRERHCDNGFANVELKELSMGMSGDFDVAIEEGATMVRVGSLLFQGIV